MPSRGAHIFYNNNKVNSLKIVMISICYFKKMYSKIIKLRKIII